MTRPLALTRFNTMCVAELRALRSQGYAILDSQNVYIPLKSSNDKSYDILMTATILTLILSEIYSGW